MNPLLSCHLWMKCPRKYSRLPHQYGLPLMRCKNLCVFSDPCDDRRAYESDRQWRLHSLDPKICREALELSAVRVALNGDIDQSQCFGRIQSRCFPCEKNCACTCAIDRKAPLCNSLLDRIADARLLQKSSHDGALTAGNDQAIHFRKIVRRSHFKTFHLQGTQHLQVLREVAVEGQDTDYHTSTIQNMPTAEEIIELLQLKPHPTEGGYFRETYHSPLSTAIYYLLTQKTFSAMHTLPGDEIFHFYLGDPVEMLQLHPDGTGKTVILGQDLIKGMQPQVTIPGGVWQGSRLIPGGTFALLGTTMAPCFDFKDYESGNRSVLMKAFPNFIAQISKLTLE